MKTIIPQRRLLMFFIILGIIVGITLIKTALPQVLVAFNIYWLFPILVLFLILSPLGSKRLALASKQSERTAFAIWMLRIMLVQLSLYALFLGLCTLVEKNLPILAPPHSHLFENFVAHQTFEYGIFPWCAIAILLCGYGFLSFNRHQNVEFSSFFLSLFSIQQNEKAKTVLNAINRIATLVAISSSILIIIFLVTTALAPQHLYSLRGLNVTSMTVAIIFIFLLCNKWVKKRIYWLSSHAQIPIFAILLLIVVFTALLLAILAIIFGNTASVTLRVPQLVHSFVTFGWQANWNLLAIYWWLAWLPLTAIFMAKLSRGYSIRVILSVSCLVPITLGCLAHFHLLAISHLPTWLSSVITIIGFLIIFALITPEHTFDSVMQSYLPGNDKIKYRATHPFLIPLLPLIALLVCIYLISGIVLMSLLFFIVELLFSLVILLAPIGILTSLNSPQ